MAACNLDPAARAKTPALPAAVWPSSQIQDACAFSIAPLFGASFSARSNSAPAFLASPLRAAIIPTRTRTSADFGSLAKALLAHSEALSNWPDAQIALRKIQVALASLAELIGGRWLRGLFGVVPPVEAQPASIITTSASSSRRIGNSLCLRACD